MSREVVAGGGPYPGNPIRNQTEALANFAYNLAKSHRGYTDDTILYLSAFDDGAGNPMVDDAASTTAIEDGLRNWASDATSLTVYLIDHGVVDPEIPEWYFLGDGTVAPRDYLAASNLKAILDDVQSGCNPLTDLTLIVEMCYAGGFILSCSGAPAGAERIIIASTTESRLAAFGETYGTLSLSFIAFAMEPFFSPHKLDPETRTLFSAKQLIGEVKDNEIS